MALIPYMLIAVLWNWNIIGVKGVEILMSNIEVFNEIKEMITTIGFPIVCVIFMWKKITDSDEKQSNLLTELTKAITELTAYIKGSGKYGG